MTGCQDEGKYLVTAENSAGSAEQLVQVTVIRPVPPERKWSSWTESVGSWIVGGWHYGFTQSPGMC